MVVPLWLSDEPVVWSQLPPLELKSYPKLGPAVPTLSVKMYLVEKTPKVKESLEKTGPEAVPGISTAPLDGQMGFLSQNSPQAAKLAVVVVLLDAAVTVT